MNDPSISEGNDPKTLLLLGVGAAILIIAWLVILTFYSSSEEVPSNSVANDPSSSTSSVSDNYFSSEGVDVNGSQANSSSEMLALNDFSIDHDTEDSNSISNDAGLLTPKEYEEVPRQIDTDSGVSPETTNHEHGNLVPVDQSTLESTSERDQDTRVAWDQIIDNKTWQMVELAPNLNKTLAIMGKGNFQLIVSADEKFRFRSGSRVGVSGEVDDTRGFPLSTDLEFKAIGEGFQVLSFRLERQE